MSASLLTRHRPQTLDEVVGQPAAVKAVKGAVAKRNTRAFLFTGPAGTGKTTLARIVAHDLGCRPDDLTELDAATNSGVDDVREIIETLKWRPIGEGDVKVILIDECHSLSKNAWQALLKSIEEPPEHVFWCLCTTEAGKVPKTIVTRCLKVDLQPVSRADLEDLLTKVADAEGMGDNIDEGMISLCVKHADGSPRQALSNLAAIQDVSDKREAADLLRDASEQPEAFDIAKALVGRRHWGELMGLVEGLPDNVNPETVRHVVRAYFTKVAMGGKDVDDALTVLEAFSEPFNSNDGVTPLVLALGRVIYGE